jgi:hypothetical protein
MKKKLKLVLIVLLLTFFSDPTYASLRQSRDQRLTLKVVKQLKAWKNPLNEWNHLGRVKIDSAAVISSDRKLHLYFSTPLSYFPVREELCEQLKQSLKGLLSGKFRSYEFKLYTDNHTLDQLIPNSYRKTLANDENRIPVSGKASRIPVVRKQGSLIPSGGLYNNNIALWCSHGWYYNLKSDRWEWQRPRLFETVEDMFTKSITVPYLVPMLENSGATVLLPVERDWQTDEVIVDNDWSSHGSALRLPAGTPLLKTDKGFLWKDTLFTGENPFILGTSLTYGTKPDLSSQVTFNPELEGGEYAVYVSYRSYENSSSEVLVTVNAGSARHSYLVNQKIGGGTWIYLGTFIFPGGEGTLPAKQSVSVNLNGKEHEVISIDAVRFGGGMGNVARRPAESIIPNKWSVNDNAGNTSDSVKSNPEMFSWKTSGKSRYREGARYYLQYAGFPDTLVFNLNSGKNDYNDDYQSRGEWVNYLRGNPDGPQKNRRVKGFQIPVDLAFAFHSDAGITPDDSVIGTLGIYSTLPDKGKFPNTSSRMASRDLTDLIQTQTVNDIREMFNSGWTRRGLWDREYSEVWRPNVPSMLMELLSHQNLADQRFGLDPRFQFGVARAIYKGMLKFQAFQERRNYVVQPLPVDHCALLFEGDTAIRLSWEIVEDPLESTALPGSFKVYVQINNEGWDDGTLVESSPFTIRIAEKKAKYDFKVTALNEGGESFPSEVLSAGVVSNSKGTVLVINAFDRICGPAIYNSPGKAGIEWWRDQGVPWKYNSAFSGHQFDFDRKSEWTDNDNQGWGSSSAEGDMLRIPGNSFDFTGIHGKAINNAGYNFISMSDEAFCEPSTDLSGFSAVDVLCGEEKSTPSLKNPSIAEFRIYTRPFIEKIEAVCHQGGNILISGAYVGSDLFEKHDSAAIKFGRDVLHFTWRTTLASKTGNFANTDFVRNWINVKGTFNTTYHPEIYSTEAPDGIEPSGKHAFTALRYEENGISAGVLYAGKYKTMVIGFPIETILSNETLDDLMNQILNFFMSK